MGNKKFQMGGEINMPTHMERWKDFIVVFGPPEKDYDRVLFGSELIEDFKMPDENIINDYLEIKDKCNLPDELIGGLLKIIVIEEKCIKGALGYNTLSLVSAAMPPELKVLLKQVIDPNIRGAIEKL